MNLNRGGMQVWAYAKLLPVGQPLMGPLHALLQAVPDHVVRQLADDSQHHKVGCINFYCPRQCHAACGVGLISCAAASCVATTLLSPALTSVKSHN